MNERGTPRRGVLRRLVAAAAVALPAGREARASETPRGEEPRPQEPGGKEAERGAQRLSLEQLRKWESLGFGMFLHFGMSSFDGHELSDGRSPSSLYAPDALDVDQWVSVARDAGMTYAVLTAKHVAGHCLWPSRHTTYTVANSRDRTDVCERFVDACRKRGVLPGFYYCSWDKHNRFGSRTASDEGFKWGNWPSDLIAIERALPPESGHRPWRTIEGREYYMPGEVCEPIGKHWFHVEYDAPRPDAALVELFQACRSRGVNLLLDVPPDRHGPIPEASVQALMRLRPDRS